MNTWEFHRRPLTQTWAPTVALLTQFFTWHKENFKLLWLSQYFFFDPRSPELPTTLDMRYLPFNTRMSSFWHFLTILEFTFAFLILELLLPIALVASCYCTDPLRNVIVLHWTFGSQSLLVWPGELKTFQIVRSLARPVSRSSVLRRSSCILHYSSDQSNIYISKINIVLSLTK